MSRVLVVVAASTAAVWLSFEVALALLSLEQPYERSYKDLMFTDEKKHNKGGRKRVDVLSMNPPYPVGWYCIAYSSELHPGTGTRYLRALGKDMVIFRGESGRVFVIDAFCSHLGANLAEGGFVRGDCITCPFHNWTFEGATGQCVSTSTSSSKSSSMSMIPAQAHLTPYRVVEVDGMVMLWSDFGNVDDPPYPPPTCPALADRTNYSIIGKSTHTVQCHICDIPENGADVAHLDTLHGKFVIPFLRPLGFTHAWWATWDVDPDNKHRSLLVINESTVVCGHKLPSCLDVQVKGSQIGPSVVLLTFATPFGNIHLIETILPLAPLLQKVTHHVVANRWVPRLLSHLFFYSAVKQFERDVPIWSTKIWLPLPVLSREDGPIAKFRRWYAQFYMPCCTSFAQAVQDEEERHIEW